MRAILLAFSCCILLICSQALAVERVTIYGDDGYAPYSYLENGQVRGIYVDILQQAFRMMPDYDVTITLVPWKRGLRLIESGRAFALFPPYHQPVLRPWMAPYSEPILEEAVVIMCHEDVMAHTRPYWPDDYKGLLVGFNEGFAVGRNAGREGVIRAEEAASNEINVLKLINRRIDCYVNDRLAIHFALHALKGDRRFKGGMKFIEGPVLSREFGYLGFSSAGAFPFRNDFIMQFNTIIRKMKAKGAIADIVRKYMQQ